MARPVPAVQRAARIMDLLVAHRDERFSMSDIVRRTGTSLGTAHALLAELEAAGYVTRHPRNKTYGLGPALVAAGLAALAQQPALRAAEDEIGQLAYDLSADVAVSAPTNTEIVIVHRAATHSPFGPGFREGDRIPLIPPIGAVFMAWAGPEEVRAWRERAPKLDQRSWKRTGRALASIRSRGYAVTHMSTAYEAFRSAMLSLAMQPRRADIRATVDDLLARLALEQYEAIDIDDAAAYDVSMIAAPIFDADLRVLATFSASGFPPGIVGADVAAIGERVRASAVRVTKQTRGRLPD
jgi:DNA-binding IclR family transcriptional regulator